MYFKPYILNSRNKLFNNKVLNNLILRATPRKYQLDVEIVKK